MSEQPFSANVLEQLSSAVPPKAGVISVYLNTSTGRSAGQGYLLAYRDACKQLRQDLPASEREPFEAAAAQAEAHLTGPFVGGRPGLALFAAGRKEYFFAVSLPVPPGDAVHWDERPYLEPLQAIVDDEERVAVALVDQERARLFTIFLGAIETAQTFQDEVPGKQRTGGWFALAQTHYARHREHLVLRHLKRTSAALTALARTHPFDRLFVAGPDEALAMLQHHLPRPLRARLAGTLRLELFAPDTAVLEAALKAAEAVERKQELTSVEELVDAATTPFVALGIDQTLAAVAEGRVHRLFLARSLQLSGGECEDCGRLTRGSIGACPVCAGQLTACSELGERVLERALADGARVEVVAGAAEQRLLEFDGLGAWIRYTVLRREA